MTKILVVEDDLSIHEMLNEILKKNGYEVESAYSGVEAVRLLKKKTVDLVLLDLMLPDFSGEDIISMVDGVPIIVLSAKTNEGTKVECLLSGANDYVTKPFSKDELLARIEVQLRKKDKQIERLQFGDLKLDRDLRVLFVKDVKLQLTKTECAIMEILMSNPNDVTTKSKMLNKITLYTEDCDENSLKVHIFNIRKKMKTATKKDYIESVYGIGFKLKD